MPKLRAVKIVLKMIEGRDSDREVVTENTKNIWHDANWQLIEWSRYVSKGIGYNKCRYSVVWADGVEYSGRYDLKHHDDEYPDLSKHVTAQFKLFSGLHRPQWLTEEHYKDVLLNINTTSYQWLLEKYLAGDYE